MASEHKTTSVEVEKMSSFVIGRVVDPEFREVTTKQGVSRCIFSFGLLSGRNCYAFDIFDDVNIYEKVSSFSDGDIVIAVVGTLIDGSGRLRIYLNEIGECPHEMRQTLLSLVRV